MSKAIKRLYTRAGITPPKGKGEHTLLFHKCSVNYMKKGLSKQESYKRCMGGLGRNLSVNPSHRNPNYHGPNM